MAPVRDSGRSQELVPSRLECRPLNEQDASENHAHMRAATNAPTQGDEDQEIDRDVLYEVDAIGETESPSVFPCYNVQLIVREGWRHDTHKTCVSRRTYHCTDGARGKRRFPQASRRSAPSAEDPRLPLFLRVWPTQRFWLRAAVPPPLAYALPPGPLRPAYRLCQHAVRRRMPPHSSAITRNRYVSVSLWSGLQKFLPWTARSHRRQLLATRWSMAQELGRPLGPGSKALRMRPRASRVERTTYSCITR
jgi:hypothetical protein